LVDLAEQIKSRGSNILKLESQMRETLTSLVFVLTLVAINVFQRSALAQSAPASQTGPKPASAKTVGEMFKNIQVLTEFKDAPANDLWGAMQFMSGSLSVSCNYCHVSQQGPFDSDANKTKLIARDMIKMMRAINQINFSGRQVVTCNTCHRGSTRPNGTPDPWYKTPEQIAAYNRIRPSATPNNNSTGATPVSPPAGSTQALPDVDQVMANYRRAVGAEAVKSIHISGTNVVAMGGSVPFEAYLVLPDKMLIGTSNHGAEVQTIWNGDHGWRLALRVRTPLSLDQFAPIRTRMEPILLPVKYEKSEAPRKVAGIEKIGDRSYYVVESHTAKQSERMYFDVQSGLLYKVRTEFVTWLGTRVEERTFEDYRDVKGVKLAGLITNHYMEDQSLFKISEIQTNIEVDPAKFEPPAPPEVKSIKLDPGILEAYVGEYQLTPGVVFTCTREGDRLFITQPNSPLKFELFAETETVFFVKQVDAEITFVKNDKGQVTHLVLNQNNVKREMTKVK
jgi:Photosynthetic reaction centre cytochrome C subunit/Domain of unknown function (DUF3471)